MGKAIIKISDSQQDFYLEWSTSSDSPCSYGMPLEEFKEYYRKEYGEQGMRDLPERLEIVERNGCSLDYDTIDGMLARNQAGEDCL